MLLSVPRYLVNMISQKILPLPVVAVCGATGTGKSRLAIDVGRIFYGEVINTDAMQLYEGLEIATNKVTPTEAANVPHHLLGVFPASLAGKIDVRTYRDKCLSLIAKITAENQHIPILTGGTHYYLESVLWSDFLAESVNTNPSKDAELIASLSLPTDPAECYAKLKQINPSVATRLHPNNVRKVRRALVEALQQQQQHHAEQPPATAVQSSCGPEAGPPNRSYVPRFPGQTLIFWLDCDGDVLNGHLDQRVDAMVEAGLIDELDRFLAHFPLRNGCETQDPSLTECDKISQLFGTELTAKSDPFVRRGVLQSIGFKEFADYLALPAGSSARASVEGQQLLRSAIDRVKIATRQYARRQVRWIRNRFLRRPALGGLPVYRISVTELLRSDCPTESADWDRLVLAPVVRTVHDHLIRSGGSPLIARLRNARSDALLALCPADAAPEPCPFREDEEPVAADLGDASSLVCTACSDRVFTRMEDWRAHIQSRSHQKRVSKLRRRALLQSVACDDG